MFSAFSLGIVGHGTEKFTKRTEALAKDAIARAIYWYKPSQIVSGHSPMGGVDIWAEEAAKAHSIAEKIYAPTDFYWGSVGGYKERNLKIAKSSDVVLVIVVEEYPKLYAGMRFDNCYHCKGRNPKHVKSGACWTAWKSGVGQWKIIK
jgi:hypothetical protein